MLWSVAASHLFMSEDKDKYCFQLRRIQVADELIPGWFRHASH